MTKKKSIRGVGGMTEESVINFLHQYFTSFEDNLKRNNFTSLNTRLPCVIIEKFKKLFQLWDTNIILERSINEDLFVEVFSTMRDVFEEKSSDIDSIYEGNFLLECKGCGEEIPLRNNNVRYSYEHHITSPEHLEFTENLNIETSLPDTTEEKKLYKKTTSKNELRIKFQRQNGHRAVIVLNNSSSSDESQEMASPVSQVRTGKTNVPKSKPILMKDSDVNFLEFRDFTMICKLCDHKLPSTSKIVLHMNSAPHFIMRSRLKSNEKYMDIMENYSVRCMLCKTTHSKVYSFLKHCESSIHRIKSNGLSGYQYSRCYLRRWNDSVVDVLTEEFHCNICMISIIGIEQVFEHFKRVHRIKL